MKVYKNFCLYIHGEIKNTWGLYKNFVSSSIQRWEFTISTPKRKKSYNIRNRRKLQRTWQRKVQQTQKILHQVHSEVHSLIMRIHKITLRVGNFIEHLASKLYLITPKINLILSFKKFASFPWWVLPWRRRSILFVWYRDLIWTQPSSRKMSEPAWWAEGLLSSKSNG